MGRKRIDKGILAFKEVSFYYLTFALVPFVAVISYIVDFYLILAIASFVCWLRVDAHTSIHGNNYRVIHLGTSLRIPAMVFTVVLFQLLMSSLNRDAENFMEEIAIERTRCTVQESLTERGMAVATGVTSLFTIPIRYTEKGVSIAINSLSEDYAIFRSEHVRKITYNLSKDAVYFNKRELKIRDLASSYETSICRGVTIGEAIYEKIFRGTVLFIRMTFKMWALSFVIFGAVSVYLLNMYLRRRKPKKKIEISF